MGHAFSPITGLADHSAKTCGQDSLDGGQSGMLGENVKDFLHADAVAAQNIALAGAALLAGAENGLGHVAVVGAVEGALDAGGHLALHVLLDNAGDVAEGIVAGTGDTAGEDQAAVDLSVVNGIQHQLGGGRLGLVVNADHGVGIKVVDFLDGGAHGLLGDGAGGADEDEAGVVLLALVDDVLRAVHVHMPDLVGHQIADGDHRGTVDHIGGSIFRDVRELGLQRRDVGHVALDNLRAFWQMLGRFLAPQDEGADVLVVADQLADDGAAQVAGRAGDDVKLVMVGIGVHFMILRIQK